jgi:hypothetical protein
MLHDKEQLATVISQKTVAQKTLQQALNTYLTSDSIVCLIIIKRKLQQQIKVLQNYIQILRHAHALEQFDASNKKAIDDDAIIIAIKLYSNWQRQVNFIKLLIIHIF